MVIFLVLDDGVDKDVRTAPAMSDTAVIHPTQKQMPTCR